MNPPHRRIRRRTPRRDPGPLRPRRAQHRNDARRGWKTDTDADEIEGLAQALAGDLSVYTAAGVRTMQTRRV